MPLVNDDILKEVIRQNDIVDVMSEYIELIPKGKNYFCICPFHDDHNPSMSVSREKQIYTCFVCHKTGNVISFLRDYLGISGIEAVYKLCDRAGIKVDHKIKSEDKFASSHKEYYDVYETASKYYKNNLNTKLGEKAKAYLEKRGLTAKEINEFDVGLSINEKDGLSKILNKKYDKAIPLSLGLEYLYEESYIDTYRNRIMFPLKDLDGRIVGFSGRIYLDGQEGSKYVNSKESPIFKKSRLLYNYHNAKEKIRKSKEIIICEGFMDVIRLSTIGINNVVALMGTSFTNDHLDIIKKLKVPVTLCLDNDEPGKIATLSIGDELQNNDIVTNVIVIEGTKDVDEYIIKYGKDAFISTYNNKISFIDFKLDRLKKNKNLNDSVDLSKYINEAIKAIDLIDDQILRELKIKEISKTYDISEDIIRSKISNKKEIISKNNEKNATQNEKKRYNKYQMSEFRIIYLMLNYKEVIRIYEKKLGHLINPDMKRLANEIVYFKENHGEFNYAEFLTYIEYDEELKRAYELVNTYPQTEGYTSEELEDYITTIQEGSYRKEVEKLKNKMKETLDINEKKRIATKIEKMKKEVLKW